MKDYNVVLPAENGCIVEFTQEDMPGIANIRSALRDFEPKIVFAWHLSVVLQSEQVVENGMPSKAEQRVLDGCCDALDSAFKGPDAANPNALFLARITWNATQELVYRVYEPAPIDAYLRRVIDERSFPREFDYRMDHDPEWKLTEGNSACQRPNQAMRRIASKAATAAVSVCHPHLGSVARCIGLAVADLVSR